MFSVVVAASGAVYAYLSGPLLSLLLREGRGAGGGAAGLLPQGLRSLAEAFLPHARAVGGAPGGGVLWIVASLLVVVAAIKGGAQLAQTALLARAVAEVGARLRGRVFSHLLRLPLAAHRRLTAGELMARLIDDTTRVEGAVVEAPLVLAREGLAAVALLALIVVLAGPLALVALATLPLTGVVIHAVGRRVKGHAARGQEALGDFARDAGQGLRAVRELKSLGAEQRHSARVAAEATRAGGWRWRQAIVRAMSPFFNEVAGALALGGALIYAGSLVARGAIEARVLISLLTALLLLYKPIKGIGNAISQIAAGRASVDRLGELLVLVPEDTGELVETSRGSRAGPRPVLMRRLVLSGVGFCHGETWVFRGIDLALWPGEIVAIRGVSGAGKSTLCDILAGLEGPTEGNIHWDDEVFGATETIQLRGRVALVPQQPLLWPGSVADNLRDAAPEAPEADLWAALDAAGLADRVRALSSALDTSIGPGSGAGLSVGEVQRLALARALLRDRSVIVLDEPSSALDDDHETRLLQTLEGLRPGRVIVLVSHRPTLLAGADRLFELRDGDLEEVTGALS